MDSAYMGDVLRQIARDEWGVDLVGTCQVNCTGAGVQGKKAKVAMKVGSYETVMFLHQNLPLTYAMWVHLKF